MFVRRTCGSADTCRARAGWLALWWWAHHGHTAYASVGGASIGACSACVRHGLDSRLLQGLGSVACCCTLMQVALTAGPAFLPRSGGALPSASDRIYAWAFCRIY